jgi:hypothetical protein
MSTDDLNWILHFKQLNNFVNYMAGFVPQYPAMRHLRSSSSSHALVVKATIQWKYELRLFDISKSVLRFVELRSQLKLCKQDNIFTLSYEVLIDVQELKRVKGTLCFFSHF